MIVLCGLLDPSALRDPFTVTLAEQAAQAGASIEIVGLVPDGADGDRFVLRLASAGIGHAALLRAPSRPLEAADIDLALRYLPEVRVVVACELADELLTVAVAGAAFAGATSIVITSASGVAPENRDADVATFVLAAPADGSDDAFAGFVAGFATRLDSGEVPAEAWAATIRTLAVDAVT